MEMISSGSASVVGAIRAAAQAAVAAAKAELQIHSPSHVFRDEVGVMTMRGFGEGVERESRHQAEIIANAARYLIIRNEDDARNLAIQIASLTKKQQVGYSGNGVIALGG